MRRKTLAQRNREALEGRDDEARWYVVPAEPISRLFCSVEGKEHVTVMAAMLSRKVMCSVLPTDMDGVVCVECDPPVESITLREQFMRSFVPILRRNGVRGRYTSDLDKWYDF